MTDAFTPRPAPTQGALSPRLALWTELEALHEQLGREPPTETLTIEELEEAVAQLRAQAQGTS